jgi:hypothetical protein
MPARPAALRPPPRIGGRNCVTSSGLAGFAEQAAKPATEIGQAGGLTATFGDPRAGTSHRNTTAQIVLTCADRRSACIRLVTTQASLGLRPHCARPKAHCRPHNANGCPRQGSRAPNICLSSEREQQVSARADCPGSVRHGMGHSWRPRGCRPGRWPDCWPPVTPPRRSADRRPARPPRP